MRSHRHSLDMVEFDLEINGRAYFVRASAKVLAPDEMNPAPHITRLDIDVYVRTPEDDVLANRHEFDDATWVVVEEEAADKLYGDFNERAEAAREERRIYA